MEFFTPRLVFVLTMVLAGSAVQGMVGFASGLIVGPVLVMAGWSLPEAIGVNLVAGVAQNVYGAYHLREWILWREWIRPNSIRVLFLPLGVWALTYANQLQPTVVRQILGVVVLGVVILFWLWRVPPKQSVQDGWEFLAMSCSGFFAGFCGIGGPPLVLWVTSHTWPPQRARAFLFCAFSLTLIPHAGLLSWQFSTEAAAGLTLGCIAVPAAWLGTRVGLALGNRLQREPLRQAMFCVLAVLSVMLVITPWLH